MNPRLRRSLRPPLWIQSLLLLLPPGNGGGGWFWKLMGFTLVSAGGVVGYAWYDAGFRRTLEGSVPYSKETLDYIYDFLPPASGAPEAPKKPQSADPLKKKEVVVAKDVPVAKSSKPATTASTAAPAAPVAATAVAATAVAVKQEAKGGKQDVTKREAEEKKRQEKERAEQTLREQEQKEASDNKELEFLLEKVLADSTRAVTAAVTSYQTAIEAVRNHTKQIKEAMESSSSESQWAAATGSNQARTEAVWASDAANEKAKTNLEKLKTSIADGKNKPTTKKNKALTNSEAEVNKLNGTLAAAVAELAKAQSEAKVVAEYRDLVKKGKEQFKKELESILPDVKLGEKKGKLTEDELNALIAHAHRRVEQLQRALAAQQAEEQQRLSIALERQQQEDAALAEGLIKREREGMGAEMDVAKQNWERDARVEQERELRAALSRQAAAHSDHIVEVLRVQQRELDARHQLALAERLNEEEARFQHEVIGWVTRLHGIEAAVEARAELEKRGRAAQELWLACQTLHTAITRGLPPPSTPHKGLPVPAEDRLRPLAPELKTIRGAAGTSPYVATVLDSIPCPAEHRGVWTEAALLERFERVATVGRRVAMIDESGGSLWRYALSYAQSMLVVRRRPLGKDDSIVVTPPGEGPDTLALLDSAAACLERGDLEQGVRFVNQLRGEARRVTADWLAEARLTLETRQAAEALLAFATASGLASLF